MKTVRLARVLAGAAKCAVPLIIFAGLFPTAPATGSTTSRHNLASDTRVLNSSPMVKFKVKRGHGSPQKAFESMIAGLFSSNPIDGCGFMVPTEFNSCASTVTGVTFHGSVTVRKTVIVGSEALVSVTGRYCESNSSKTACETNNNRYYEMPNGETTFDEAFSAASASTTTLSPVPCEKIKGNWYVITTQ
jgi:hypothetical protein